MEDIQRMTKRSESEDPVDEGRGGDEAEGIVIKARETYKRCKKTYETGRGRAKESSEQSDIGASDAGALVYSSWRILQDNQASMHAAAIGRCLYSIGIRRRIHQPSQRPTTTTISWDLRHAWLAVCKPFFVYSYTAMVHDFINEQLLQFHRSLVIIIYRYFWWNTWWNRNI